MVSNQYLVAYSGGVDSHVLLHQLVQAGDASFLVIHVNHGLDPKADFWQQHCADICESLAVPFKAVRINVIKKPRHSLEAIARELRYQVFAEFLTPGAVLVTGHNQNDQAETVLLQLMRGAGVKGLSGMPFEKPFAAGVHRRPLLTWSRNEIEAYAREHQLCWIDDPSNARNDFDRNFLRNTIIPELAVRREGVVANIARSAKHLATTAELLDELALIDYQVVQGTENACLSIPAIKTLSDMRQSNVLRYWLGLLRVQLPSEAIMYQIKKQLLHSCPSAVPEVRWGKVVLHRCSSDQQQLRCIRLGDT